MPEIPKAYEPANVESKLYSFWMEQGYFTPKINPDKKPFTIIMPPPNVTGELHIGHTLFITYDDIMTRWHRMKGDPTLWLPGVDHAGIATQVVVEQNLLKQGIDRHIIGRAKFVEYVWQWVGNSRRSIMQQHQRLGASADWTRERFTLDEVPTLAVRTAFVRLYNKGLIYRGERIITWCPRCRTALSDLEVDHKDITGNLYYIHYPLADGSGHITVATTRPETYLGDTAVAVNPDDKRHRHLLGKKVILPIINRAIPIIADSAIDTEFGTGLVKVTPAHDPVDFEISQRQNLPLINIMNPDATMNENAGPYAGMDRFACRKKVMEDLQKLGLVEKVEPHSHAVGHCERCQTISEPLASQQWFVKIAPLAKRAIEAVDKGQIKIIPERFHKVYLNWMENIRDWCISRQLWWGHQMPVWYCSKCGEIIAAIETPAKCSRCNSQELVQETDVLDTWFSSALWTHSTLGWPGNTEDLRYFYPTSVMVTGYDILFFWVARMIMMGLEDMDDIPFHTVYLNGLIRDEKGHKISKVRGNVINPLVVIDKYGTDALRFAVTTGVAPGNDINLGEQKLEAARNFANKLWNASRFVLQNVDKLPVNSGELTRLDSHQPEPLEDLWILSRLNRLIQNVNAMMVDFQFGEAEREIHDFLWGEYCDWYLEIAKLRLNQPANSPLPVAIYVLEKTLRLLHPFMPFITEEIWQNIKQRVPDWNREITSIMVASYPEANSSFIDSAAERIMDSVIEITRAIRNIRAEYKVNATKWIEARIYSQELTAAISQKAEIIEVLSHARPLSVQSRDIRKLTNEKTVAVVLKESEVIVPLVEIIDLAAEKKRLEAELTQAQQDIERVTARLSDDAFRSKAPPTVVNKEQVKLQASQDKIGRLQEELSRLS
jgi:valyl-tRNA synthetase